MKIIIFLPSTIRKGIGQVCSDDHDSHHHHLGTIHLLGLCPRQIPASVAPEVCEIPSLLGGGGERSEIIV
jgi:hypothetical protein